MFQGNFTWCTNQFLEQVQQIYLFYSLLYQRAPWFKVRKDIYNLEKTIHTNGLS